MARPVKRTTARPPLDGDAKQQPPSVRIIGGRLRGRKLPHSGDARTRPMKDRVREALFNLIGPAVVGSHAIDLFAGTGALAFEAISRGAAAATLIERHFPTADEIRRMADELGVADLCRVVAGDTFIWAKRESPQRETPAGDMPWLVFVSPPYALYAERQGDMLQLIGGLLDRAPPGSQMVVEADDNFDFNLLPEHASWDVRAYPPAVVGIYRKPRAN